MVVGSGATPCAASADVSAAVAVSRHGARRASTLSAGFSLGDDDISFTRDTVEERLKKREKKGKKRGISHENEEQQKSDDKKDLENKNTRKKREDEVDVERGSLEMAIAATFLQRDEIDIVPVATTSRRGCR